MPIQISEDTRYSSAYAVNRAQNAFAINRDAEGKRTDGFMKDAAKVVARIPTNAVLGVVAAIETVVKAVLTGLSAILLIIREDRPYNHMKASLSLAGRTTVEAFKGIAGYATAKPEVKKEEPVVIETPKEEPVLSRLDKAKNGCLVILDYKKTLIGLGLLAAGLIAARQFGIPSVGFFSSNTTQALNSTNITATVCKLVNKTA